MLHLKLEPKSCIAVRAARTQSECIFLQMLCGGNETKEKDINDQSEALLTDDF